MLWVLIRIASAAILLSTHNICFYRELMKSILQLSSKPSLTVLLVHYNLTSSSPWPLRSCLIIVKFGVFGPALASASFLLLSFSAFLLTSSSAFFRFLSSWREMSWATSCKIRAVTGQRSSPELCLANKTKMSLRANIKRKQNHLTSMERQIHWKVNYRSLWPKFILRSNVVLHWHIFQKYDVHSLNTAQDIR